MSVLAEWGPISQLPFQSSKSATVTVSPSPSSYSTTTPSPAFLQSASKSKHTVTVTTIEHPPTQSISISNSNSNSNQSNHRHSRTVSSTTLPTDPFQKAAAPYSSHSRTPSGSGPPTMNNISMQRQPTNSSTLSGLPRRSTSGRSAASNSPTSYVALMRKQKATVWCDRSQSTDPRTAAAQKAARLRAHLEVSHSMAAGSSARTSTLSSSGVVGKIRHGGVPKTPGYVPGNMSGAGVPMRLSANEMLGDEDEERSFISGDNTMVHGRSGSGKSSASSAKYRSGYPRPDQGRFSGGTPPSGGEGGSPASRDRIAEEDPNSKCEYFTTREKPQSADEDSFGELKDLAGPSIVNARMSQAKTNDDLRRRGSVDERAMTMGSNVKLFVANPDADTD